MKKVSSPFMAAKFLGLCPTTTNKPYLHLNLRGRPISMAFSLSSSLFPKPFLSFRTIQRSNFRSKSYPLRLFCCSGSPQNRQLSSDSEKKSFAVATGELFLGIASRLIRTAEKRSSGPPIDETSDNGERIASVIEDKVEPDVIWEQRVKDVEAEKERKVVTSPGFSFSAAGLLFPYHLGVAQFLVEKGYIKETTPLAGSSAGAIICAVIACGISTERALKATKNIAEDCRLKGTAFRLGALLRDCLEELLPEDAHTYCNGRIRVAITQITWRPRGLLVDQFDSKRDLINAIFTSSFIPGYLSPRPATMFRNRLCVDGGLTFLMPPTSASKTVRVCAFPTSSFGVKEIGISPDCNPEKRASPRQLFNWALEPAEDEVLDRLFELGYADAATWAEKNPVDEMVHDDTSSSADNVSDSLQTRT